ADSAYSPGLTSVPIVTETKAGTRLPPRTLTDVCLPPFWPYSTLPSLFVTSMPMLYSTVPSSPTLRFSMSKLITNSSGARTFGASTPTGSLSPRRVLSRCRVTRWFPFVGQVGNLPGGEAGYQPAPRNLHRESHHGPAEGQGRDRHRRRLGHRPGHLRAVRGGG